jgi:hypothetical protein
MLRDDAYRLVQDAAQRAFDEGIPFADLLAEQLATSPDAPEGVAARVAAINFEDYLGNLDEPFARLEALRSER